MVVVVAVVYVELVVIVVDVELVVVVVVVDVDVEVAHPQGDLCIRVLCGESGLRALLALRGNKID